MQYLILKKLHYQNWSLNSTATLKTKQVKNVVTANLSQLRMKHAVCLDSNTVIILPVTKKPDGRPTLPYNAKGNRSRRRRAAELAKSHNVSWLVYAASFAARKKNS